MVSYSFVTAPFQIQSSLPFPESNNYLVKMWALTTFDKLVIRIMQLKAKIKLFAT